MKLLTFILPSDPQAIPLLGLLVDNDRTVISLQASRQVMSKDIVPFLVDMLAFLDGGEAAREEVAKIRDFVSTQRPAGTTYPLTVNQKVFPLGRVLRTPQVSATNYYRKISITYSLHNK